MKIYINQIILFVFFASLIIHAGCDADDKEVEPAKLIGFSMPKSADGFMKSLSDELFNNLKAEGYLLVETNADGKVENQEKQVQALLDLQMEALILVGSQSNLLILDEVKNAGIPIVNIRIPLVNADVPDAQIRTDSHSEGKLAAHVINNLVQYEKNYQILYTVGASTDEERALRISGIEENLNQSINKFANPLSCVDSLSALSRARNILSRDIEFGIAFDDISLTGFVKALEQSDKTTDDFKIIVFSGSPLSKKYLHENKIKAIIAQSPKAMAEITGETCVNLLNSKNTEKNVFLESFLITSDNISDYDLNAWQ